MRKACFAFVMVLAAFTGGAFMNGPGLSWLKSAIRSRLEGTSPPVQSTQRPTSLKDRPDSSSTTARREVPAAPLPPLTLDLLKPTAETPKPAVPLDSTPAATINIASPASKALAVPPDPDAKIDPAVVPAKGDVIPPVGDLRDWSEVRRRMTELGVSRYELEGRPGAKSRFRCVIPLAGRRAVNQEFEGEGDDDLQAADAALRRLALWKATEILTK